MTASYHSYLPSPRKTILILKTTDMELNNKKKNKKKIGKTQVSHHVKVNIRHINGAIQVENAKIIISMLLIFSCSIIMTLLLSTTPNLLCSTKKPPSPSRSKPATTSLHLPSFRNPSSSPKKKKKKKKKTTTLSFTT